MRLLMIAILLLTLTPKTLAHGEGDKGPHGGFIRMPGAWHTELLEDSNSKNIKIYLLDLEFKNPMTKNSKLTLTLKKSGEKDDASPVHCETKQDHFECSLEKLVLSKGDQLEVLAERDGQAGGVAIYPYPFELTKH